MRRLVLALPLLLLASACEVVERPMRPLPDQFFEAKTLDGRSVDRAFLAGRPWVVNLWVPG